MRISDPGSDHATAVFTARSLRSPWGLRREPLAQHAPRGFTLLELLVVITIIAIASAAVSVSMRDGTQTMLEREATRLAALLEAGRALSRSSGQTIRWRDTPQGFNFEGLNAASLPHNWLRADTTVRWDAGISSNTLTLGPEPIIEPQALTLIQDNRSIRLATDGLHPFAVQTAR